MYKEILRGIAGIGVFPVISLVVFVTIFAIMLLRVVCMDRAGLQHLAGLPLDDDGAAGEEGMR